MLFHQLTSRRHRRATGCAGQRSAYYHIAGTKLLVAVNHDARDVQARMNRLLADVHQLDVLLYVTKDGSASSNVTRWVRTHCKPLVSHSSKGRAESGTAFRCVAAPSTGGPRKVSPACKAVKRFHARRSGK